MIYILKMFDSNLVQNDFFYQTWGSIDLHFYKILNVLLLDVGLILILIQSIKMLS
jgi:hypothetical protein